MEHGKLDNITNGFPVVSKLHFVQTPHIHSASKVVIVS